MVGGWLPSNGRSGRCQCALMGKKAAGNKAPRRTHSKTTSAVRRRSRVRPASWRAVRPHRCRKLRAVSARRSIPRVRGRLAVIGARVFGRVQRGAAPDVWHRRLRQRGRPRCCCPPGRRAVRRSATRPGSQQQRQPTGRLEVRERVRQAVAPAFQPARGRSSADVFLAPRRARRSARRVAPENSTAHRPIGAPACSRPEDGQPCTCSEPRGTRRSVECAARSFRHGGAEADVDVLPATGLAAVNRDDVAPALQRRTPRRRKWEFLVARSVAAHR